MSLHRSSWLKAWFSRWFQSRRPARSRKQANQWHSPLSRRLERLEDRALLSVTVTQNTADLAANATSIVIQGTNFDPIVANDSVTFDDGASGTVTGASSTSLIVSLSTGPSTAGVMNATVTVSGSSSSATQVATVTPVVTASQTAMAADAAVLTLYGYGFDSNSANDSVSFDDGAVGSVASASGNSLTIDLSTAPSIAGEMDATVTVDTVVGTSTYVATVTPFVTNSAASLSAHATQLMIAGSGFDSNTANDSVTFDDGAVGHVTGASSTSLTVALDTDPTTAGELDAVVTTDGETSGTAAQVATVKPFVTNTAATTIVANASSLTIDGFGFDPNVAEDSVTFSDGAHGTVTGATATTLTVELTTDPTTAGSLTAQVMSDGVSSGSAVSVATVIPVITSSTANLNANATTLTINGYGFDGATANDSITLSNNATFSITAASGTSLTLALTADPDTMGSLTAAITVDSESNGSAVEVANTIPVVTNSASTLAANATSITINGFGFDSTTPADNTIVFNDGAAGHVTAATTTTLTVAVDTYPATAGVLTAVVSTDGVSSGTAAQVGTVTPVVTNTSATSVAANAATITIDGYGFDPTAGNNTVTLSSGAGTVIAATPTTLTVSLTTAPATAGILTAQVSTDSHASGSAVDVGTVIPVITSSISSLAANQTSITINGFGFDSTPANDTIMFNDGATVGSITAASPTSLTVTFGTKPTTAGSLTAKVTTDSESSGSTGVQIASVIPVVSANVANLLGASATSVTIIGLGFDTITANDSVTFNDGAAGHVTGATASTLTVALDTDPTTAGSLTAIVTTDSQSNASAVQVAKVTPVITTSSGTLAANASSLTIHGYGFDPTVANDSITFNDGAGGTITAASSTTLTVSLTTAPTTAGVLSAQVTSGTNGGVSSGVLTPVATVIPVVTSSLASLAGNATTITLSGYGFDSDVNNDKVTFDNQAVGTVTSANSTTMTVTLTSGADAVGSLTAQATVDGEASASAVEVASIVPIVSNSTVGLPANATTLTIYGYGFTPTANNSTNDSVVLNDGAVGTVTSATANSLTVSLNTAPTTAGALMAVVTSGGVSSGAAVQVGTVTPVVTNTSATVVAANAATVTISGYGFDPTIANDSISLSSGATGTITAATPTSLTVSFTGSLSTGPVTAGILTARVMADTASSGVMTPIATIIPVVTNSTTATVAANASTITINGYGFDSTALNNTIALGDGAVGHITNATPTALTVSFAEDPTTAGSLTAQVTTDALSSSTVQVALVIPVVTPNTANQLAANAAGITIFGSGFDTNYHHDSVVFNDGAVGNVTAATATTLTVSLTTDPTTAGSLTAVVTTDTEASSSPVQVAQVTPFISNNTNTLVDNASTITINGYGFDPTAANDSITFNDGAHGTVTSATANALTVSLTTAPTTAGILTAQVMVDSISSNAGVVVANVIPVVTGNTTELASDQSSITITGFGFDATATNNTVTLSDGAVGTVTTASPTSITVTFGTKPATAGSLTAIVTTDAESSGSTVQVATMTPVITSNPSNDLAASASSIVINGYGFDPSAGNDSVIFNDGAIGTVASASGTTLNVTLSTSPTTAGNLIAVVSIDGESNGALVQVATVTPTVTPDTNPMGANASTITISGTGFDTDAGEDLVSFNDGASGTVTSASGTSLTVSLTADPTTAGPLNATVQTDGVSSASPIEVANILPGVTNSTTDLSINAPTITISGAGFDPTAANDIVTFNDGAVGVVTSAGTNSLTVTFTSSPTAPANLTASVLVDGVSSGTAVQVATVVPVVTSSSANVGVNATSITIDGYGFDTTAANDTVTFDNGAVGTVTSSTTTTLTVDITTAPTTLGILTATVTSDTVANATAVEVANVIPVVSNGASTTLSDNATTLTINGFGFDPTFANDSITFNDATGTITSATTTTLTVSLTTAPTTAGVLTATVTSDSQSSGTPMQVATITPIVTNGTTSLVANATSITIHGSGFDTAIANDTVTFSDGAFGTVTGAGTTALTVSLSTSPTTAGTLTASVTVDGASSGTAVQVGTVTPVLTANSSNSLAANAATLTINGYGFDTTAANNTVTFSDGAIGTITSATPTSLSFTFLESPTTAGVLSAQVTTDGQSNGSALQVATIKPVVTSSTSSLADNATLITINGYGFDPTIANDTVAFSNNAAGTVMAATPTSLTVDLTTDPTKAGPLTAIVTADTLPSGSATEVAVVVPAITASTTTLANNPPTLTINGAGFDATAIHNSVVFNDGAVGIVTGASTTSLTVSFTSSPTIGANLTAVVTTDGNSSSTAQVGTITPTVTSSTASLVANASSITIAGTHFDPTAAHDTVTFNDGAVGTVTGATANSLTVSLGTKPTTAGSLTAIVSVNGSSSGSAVQVATVTPVVTSSVTNLAANAATVTIAGYGFDTTMAHDSVTLNDGATGTVTSATPTSLTVTFGTKPTTAANLTAIVTTDSQTSGSATQVATVIPVVTSSTVNQALNGTTMIITGFGFDATAAHNLLTFNDSAVGTVTTATPTSLLVTFGTKPAATGNLTVMVTTDSDSSGAAVQVATVSASASTPTVTSSTTSMGANSTSLVIHGTNFSATPANNTVVFNNGGVGTVTAATTTQLTVTFSTRPTTMGSLTAVVTTEGISSASAVQVATVIPVVTLSTAGLAQNVNTLTINGFGFDATAAHNTVAFSNGAVGTVTSATPTSLLVTFGTRPTSTGNMTAIVLTDSVSSGTAVQVATVKAAINSVTVTSNSTSLGASAASIVIAGTGFDTTASNNTVTFNNGAVGTVTTATTTSLTVTFGTKPTGLGSLTAIVDTDGVLSGSAVQVANVVPVVTSNSANLLATATTITISGVGFDAVTPGNNTVVFSDGATGTVTAATSTSLTVTFVNKPATAGSLTAIVTSDSQSNGSPVQVATVVPVITSAVTNLADNAGSVTINGFGFDPTKANDTITFNDGATVGTITSSSTTSLTVTLATKPTTSGVLTASLTTDNESSGTAVQVATVTPVVTSSVNSQGISSGTLTISGFGFDPIAAHNTVILSDGAVGTVSSASATALTVTLSTKPTSVGSMTAIVTTDSESSGSALEVADVIPVVTNSTVHQALNGTTLVINGFGFDSTAANDTVSFNDGAFGTVTSATATSLTVTFGTKPTATGSLTASVAADTVSSGSALQVATVVANSSTPTVTSSTASLAANAATVTIAGTNFDATSANDRVTFNDGAVGSITAATATSLTVTFSTKPTTAGSLTAIVTADGVSSASAVQVANVTPVVTNSTASLALNAATLTINGFGFDSTAAHNTVTLNDGAVGTVTNATPTSLTVSLGTAPTTAGSLTASVLTDTVTSGSAVQVATVIPTVTSSSGTLTASAGTITIAGTGFDSTTATHNTVAFNDGAIGTVTSASGTSLTVNLTTKPTTAGSLTAIVTTDGGSSGTAVQVGTVTPVVTSSTASLGANSTTITIHGFGFSTTSPVGTSNTVTFNNGAVGSVTSATATTLTVTFSTKPTSLGSLTAIVTTSGQTSGSALQVATVVPTVTNATTSVAINATTVTITGSGFDTTTLSHNSVAFNNGAAGTVTAATTTTLTVTLTTAPTAVGSLTAIVTTDGQVSGTAVQVANVVPVVISSTANQAANATTFTISGYGFDTTAAHNTVTLSNGAIGTVTGYTAANGGTPASITVTISTKPTAGNMTAIVSVDGVSSGTAVQVATVIPVVTQATTSIAASPSTVTISGVGFSTTTPLGTSNTVTFSSGAVGTVTAATATSLTVTFSTKPTAGSLTAIVTSNGKSSGAAVQIGTVL